MQKLKGYWALIDISNDGKNFSIGRIVMALDAVHFLVKIEGSTDRAAWSRIMQLADMSRLCLFKTRKELDVHVESFKPKRLTSEQIDEIRQRRADGESLLTLARAYGVSHGTISKHAKAA
jgi:hypothetical protein